MFSLTNGVGRRRLRESRHLAELNLHVREQLAVLIPRTAIHFGFFKLLRGLKILRLNLPAVDQQDESPFQNRARDQWLASCIFSDREGGIDQLLSVFITTILREIFFPVRFPDLCGSKDVLEC